MKEKGLGWRTARLAGSVGRMRLEGMERRPAPGGLEELAGLIAVGRTGVVDVKEKPLAVAAL